MNWCLLSLKDLFIFHIILPNILWIFIISYYQKHYYDSWFLFWLYAGDCYMLLLQNQWSMQVWSNTSYLCCQSHHFSVQPLNHGALPSAVAAVAAANRAGIKSLSTLRESGRKIWKVEIKKRETWREFLTRSTTNSGCVFRRAFAVYGHSVRHQLGYDIQRTKAMEVLSFDILGF